jgi:hypothetical protein
MLLTYIDSIEPLVASTHAQMQMKQAHFFFLQFVVFIVEKICVGPCFFATVVVTPLRDRVLNLRSTTLEHANHYTTDAVQYGCFESFPFRQNFAIFFRQIT